MGGIFGFHVFDLMLSIWGFYGFLVYLDFHPGKNREKETEFFYVFFDLHLSRSNIPIERMGHGPVKSIHQIVTPKFDTPATLINQKYY